MNNVTIIGAIAGDIVGSVYEFDPVKRKDFELMRPDMEVTDDSIMTIAVAEWLLESDLEHLESSALIRSMQKWGRRYPSPMGSYGGMFSRWLQAKNAEPYGSWGNGSAMRVSPVGFTFDTLQQTLHAAEMTAAVTHNHPEGIKGAQATAAAIFMARKGNSKQEIRSYIEKQFGYDLSKSCDEIRPSYRFFESCMQTVPESIIAFLDSSDFEDALRLTVSLGGDADTMGAITGGIAAAYYKKMPSALSHFVDALLPDDMRKVVNEFQTKFPLDY